LHSELHAVYTRLDGVLDGFGCGASTDCCRFGVTGREPYVTKLEVDVLLRAVRARGGIPKRRVLPIAGERPCPVLGDDGKCLVYASRPFGCRTFFCDAALREHAPGKLPRKEIASLLRELSDLSEKHDPRDGRGDPLTHALTRSSLR
jgi:Fe-S-cluster containining protein